ncbi:MAG: hypothetical protein V4819_09250 [Verrucomicrobiota bacterium]
MSEQYEPDPWQQKVPANHAVTCFRVILWLLPSAFALMSAYGFACGLQAWSRHLPFGSGIAWTIWLILNFAFVLGTGWYNALLSVNSREWWHGVRNRVILFVVIQPFIIWFFVCMTLGWLFSGGP